MSSLNLDINHYNISPLFVLLLIGGIIGIITFFFLTQHKDSPGVKYWLIWQIATSIWAFTYAFEFAATDIGSKIFWSKLSYFGIVYCAVSFFFFSLEYSANYQFLKKKFIITLYAISTLLILSPFTNGLHHLHWKSYYIIPETNATGYVYGPFFWIIFAYSYILLLIGIINIVLLFFRMSGYYKRQIFLLFIACLLPPIGNIIYVFHLNPIPGFDWTPFTFLLTGVLIAINISFNNMFELVPFARAKLIDILPDAILIMDKSMRIADYNPAMLALTHSGETELTGRHVEKIFPHRKEIIKEIISHDEYRVQLSREVNGQIDYFDLHSSTLYNQNKQSTGRLIVLKDVTNHVLAEEKIRQTNIRLTREIEEKEKLIADLDAFSHTVAHDLKNMLGAIVSASGMIKSGIYDLSTEDLVEINDLINISATKTLHITKELLTLASVRQEEIKLIPVNMHKIVLDSISRLNPMIREHNAEIVIQQKWPEVYGYEAWLEEVWINYISNALKYGGIPPVVEVGNDLLPGNHVKFWIKDNGKGLSENDMAILFNKFTRLELLRAEGNGLGLSIVKRIVEKLGGHVGVESKNIPGEGSTFYFILPMIAHAANES